MNATQIELGLGGFFIGIIIGILLVNFVIPQTEVSVITEKIVEVEKPILVVTEKIVEVEKPIITQQIVETVREVEVYRFIDETNPVHKWVDPDNQAVVYIYPEGYTGQVMPMYSLVPPVWFTQMLNTVLTLNDGVMPLEVWNSIPKEWMEAVAPGTIDQPKSSDLN